MRVVVTGGSGSIGREVVRQLLKRGDDVVNLDRRRSGRDDDDDPSHGERQARFFYADLAERSAYDHHLAEFHPDAVVHLGEIPNNYHRTNDEVFALNARSTATFLQCVAELDVKRVAYASSCQVYAQFGTSWKKEVTPPRALPHSEAEIAVPNNGYGASKLASEAYFRMLAARHDMRIASLRLPGVFQLKRAWWLKHELNDDSRLHEYNAWLEVGDAAAALIAAIEPDLAGDGFEGAEVFNVGASETRLPPSAPPIRTLLAERHPNFPALPEDFPERGALYDSTKFRRLVGWKDEITLQDLLDKAELLAKKRPF